MDTEYYIDYYDLERSHWWFTARIDILESILSKRILVNTEPNTSIKILNVGVATGATTEMLSKYGEVTSLEFDKDCCQFLFDKTGIQAVNASVTDMPFEDNSYDLVCAFDVIEHVENDFLAIQEIDRVLKPGGFTFTTVPAFQFLWGDHDLINHHFRRYTRTNYNKLLSSSTITTTYLNYFNFWLFLPISLVRVCSKVLTLAFQKKEQKSSDTEGINSNKLIGTLLGGIFNSEKYLLHLGIRLPFGVSIVHIGKKKHHHS